MRRLALRYNQTTWPLEAGEQIGPLTIDHLRPTGLRPTTALSHSEPAGRGIDSTTDVDRAFPSA